MVASKNNIPQSITLEENIILHPLSAEDVKCVKKQLLNAGILIKINYYLPSFQCCYIFTNILYFKWCFTCYVRM